MTDLNIEDADAQDLADIISGLTVIGGYCDSAGLDTDLGRIVSLRRLLVLENRELARGLVESEVNTPGSDRSSVIDGVEKILEE